MKNREKFNNATWKSTRNKIIYFSKMIWSFLYPLCTKIANTANLLYEKLPLDKINAKLGGKLDVRSPKFKKILGITFSAAAVFFLIIIICILNSIFFRETCLWCGGAGKINGTKEVRCNDCNGKGFVGKCPSCNGSGKTFVYRYTIPCLHCINGKQICKSCFQGKKNVPTVLKCNVCNGWKRVKPEVNVRVKQYCESRIRFMNAMTDLYISTFSNSAGSSYSAPSYNYSSSGGGTSSTTRRCSIHGETYDIRFGSGCAWCRQPDYGSGKTTTAKCPRHNYYYDPSIGCPICR
ncbi:MAG: hypothetical protein E7045_06105 [Lentisphaerae bacterium]|nr:hypothetical protein [Lentisphaerota bacterium]